MKKSIYGILAAFAILNAAAAEVVLIRDGKPASEIIVPQKPTRSVQMAAFELQHLIYLISGTRLAIVKTPHDGMLPIRLGPAPGEKFSGEQYKVSVRPDGISLAGNDTQDFGVVDYQNPRTFPGTGYNARDTPRHALNYHSTLLAVYDFLENCCGMRFYSFGDDGITLTPRKTLTVKTMEKNFEPKAQASRYAGVAHRDSVRVTTERERKLLQLRWRMNTVYGLVNHTVQSLFFRYWGPSKRYENVFVEKRPQYFIRGYEKMPVDRHWVQYYSPSDPPPAQICTTCPDVAKYFASEALAVYEGAAFKKPPLTGVLYRFLPKMEGKPFYYPVQENDNQDFCKCPECLKLFPGIRDFNRQAYVHFDFINRVSREAKKLDPDLNIATLAYNKCFACPDPRILKLDPGIMVQICLGVHAWMHPQIYNRQHSIYKQWIRQEGKKRPLSVWTYILSPDDEARRSYNYRNFPMVFPWQAGRIYREFMDDGIQGVFIELCTKVNLLEGYVAMRLAFDPSQDYNQIIDEYFRLYYEDAAEPMKEFYREVEKITWDPKNYPDKDVNDYVKRWIWGSVCIGIHTQKVNWTLGTPKRMEKLGKIIERVKAGAKSPAVKKRVDVFIKDIWERAVQGRLEYDQRLLVEKEPPPQYSAARLPDQQNLPKPDFARIDWKNIPAAGSWTELNTRKAAANSPQVKMAVTDRFFLIRYEENRIVPSPKGKKDMWSDGIELFVGLQGDYPFDHYAVGYNGGIAGYRHTLHDGKRVLTPLDTAEIMIADRQVEPDSWRFVLAIPRKNSPLEKDGIKRLNIIRNRPTGIPSAWSYLAPRDYASSAFRMGFVHLPESGKTADFRMPDGFAKKKNGRESWMQNVPSPKKMSAVTVSNGKATLSCSSSQVQYMAAISPLARYGDRIVVEFTASGHGKGGAGIYLYSAAGRMPAKYYGSSQQFFTVTEKPAKFRLIFDTGKLHPKFRNLVRVKPCLISQKNAEITFSGVKFSVLTGLQDGKQPE